jgi:heme exporter protein D
MPDKDPWAWAGHIYAAYGITALVLAALVGWLIWDGRRQQRRIADLEARGIRRQADET